VGSLLYLNFDFFISFKVFYSSTIANTSFTDFGSVLIEENSFDNLAAKTLYLNSPSGITLSLRENEEFLDSGAGGWHDSLTSQLGNI
jgi:hypothetical protein